MSKTRAQHTAVARQLAAEIREAKRKGTAGADTKYCILVAGEGLASELSPRIHMAAYRALRRSGRRVDLFYFPHGTSDLKGTMEAMRRPDLRIRYASITIPHKHEVLEYLDSLDGTAEKVGAVNTVVNQKGKLRGYNTDVGGARKALLEKLPSGLIPGMTAVVVGAGGTGRAVAHMLNEAGVSVTIYNRNAGKARDVAGRFGLQGGQALEELWQAGPADIIVNATKIGSEAAGMAAQSPVPFELLLVSHGAVVFDVVHTPLKTVLVAEAEELGLKTTTGDRMLLYGAEEQVQIFTKRRENGTVLRPMNHAMASFFSARRETQDSD